jgi:hypothetical protein
VLYVTHSCENLSLGSREEQRPKVFRKRVLRRIFRLQNDEVIGRWINLQNEGFITCTLRLVYVERSSH